eukprot:2178479-Amphidinium_carterae.1
MSSFQLRRAYLLQLMQHAREEVHSAPAILSRTDMLSTSCVSAGCAVREPCRSDTNPCLNHVNGSHCAKSGAREILHGLSSSNSVYIHSGWGLSSSS